MLASGKSDGPAAHKGNRSRTWNQYANANLFLTRESGQLGCELWYSTYSDVTLICFGSRPIGQRHHTSLLFVITAAMRNIFGELLARLAAGFIEGFEREIIHSSGELHFA
jgi:hypothetical protein